MFCQTFITHYSTNLHVSNLSWFNRTVVNSPFTLRTEDSSQTIWESSQNYPFCTLLYRLSNTRYHTKNELLRTLWFFALT